MKTYLVTGGAGFIGSHLTERILESGGKVYSVDNLSTGNIRNIEHLRKKYPDRFTHISQSIEKLEDSGRLSELVDMSDVIYHLAATVGVKKVHEEPAETIRNNLGSTQLILQHAAKKCKRILFTSSSEVYGKGAENGEILREEGVLVLDSPTKGDLRVSYALSKLLDEAHLLALYCEGRIKPTIVRLFNTVGPRQTGSYGMVLPRFISAALEGRDIEVFGDGKQTRCFTYVEDVIDAFLRLEKSERAIGEIFNVGSNEEVSIERLAELVREKLGSKSRIVYVPYEKAYGPGFRDMRRRVPDTSKIKRLIGWEAKTTLEEIIEKTTRWMREKEGV